MVPAAPRFRQRKGKNNMNTGMGKLAVLIIAVIALVLGLLF